MSPLSKDKTSYGALILFLNFLYKFDFDSFESKLFLSRLMRSVAGSKMFTVAVLTTENKKLTLYSNLIIII
jgi:hypothetical protein